MTKLVVLLSLVLVVFSACGQNDSSASSHDEPPRGDELKPAPTPTIPPVVVDQADFHELPDLLPTMYYTAKEKEVNCKGRYGRTGPVYNGTEKSKIIERDGSVIATVCTRFFKVLNMEGSSILKDRGQGEVAVNYSGVVNSIRRFHKLGKCAFGEGVERDLCLLPYHTLATDNKVHKIGDIIYIPKAEGLLLPDGTRHEGFFIVRDTGGAFVGIGGKRVDMFTGTDPDDNNAFLKAGFNHTNPTEAFKIEGPSADAVKLRLKEKFGDLY